MKTTTVARGFIGAVASLLGVVAVGCSADGGWEGAAGEGEEIGSTSQALTVLTNAANQNAADVADFSSSCVFKDGSDSFLIKIGGFNGAGAAISKVSMLERGAASWVLQNDTLSVARGQGQSFQIDDTHCVYIGGAAGVDGSGAASTAVDLLTFDATQALDANKVQIATLGSLAQARSDHRVSVCKDSDQSDNLHIVVAGGRNQNTFRDTIEVSRKLSDVIANAANLWDTTTNGLVTARANFGFDSNGANGLMVAGGENGGATELRSVELLRMSEVTINSVKYCDILDPQGQNDDNVLEFATGLSSGTTGTTVQFIDHAVPTTDEFIVAFGRKASAPQALFGGERLTPNFAANPMTLSAPTTDTPPAGAYRPVEVQVDATTMVYLGGSNAAVSDEVAGVHKYTEAAGWGTSVNLAAGQYGSSAGLWTSTEVALPAGALLPRALQTTTAVVQVP